MKFESNLVGRRVHVKPVHGDAYDGEIVLVRECRMTASGIAFLIRPDTDAELRAVHLGRDIMEVFK
jgi:hypothetical protein